MKRVRLAPSLRNQVVYAAIERELRGVVARGIRIIEHSVQDDHIHLVAEADDKKTLAWGMQLFFSRVARAVNRVAGRRGSLFRDRHHRHELKTPTEVRRALVYVLFNSKKHAAQIGAVSTDSYDSFSSLIWFDGWHPDAAPPADAIARRRARAGPRPLAIPKTWLARVGWKRAGGPLRFDAVLG